MIEQTFFELAKLLILTSLVTIIIKFLKQPPIIGYLLSGIICGPMLLNLIKHPETISILSQLGVVMLLFLVGITLNPKETKNYGKVAIFTGIGQVLFTTLIGTLIILIFGRFTLLEAIYLSVAYSFSSTIIIMKLLSEKNEIDTLHGRISIGFLIVQDLIAIILLIFLSSIKTGENFWNNLINFLFNGLWIFGGIFLFTRYFLSRLLDIFAKSSETLLLFSITWCISVASLFSLFNFSIEAGALIAGIALSSVPYSREIISKVKTLRDFFLILFFILLGTQINFNNVAKNLDFVTVMSLFILLGNPLIVILIMRLMRYTLRTGLYAGLTVAQISEFSLILIAMGISLGHIRADLLPLSTTIGIITFIGSTYLILYSQKIYFLLEKTIKKFSKKSYIAKIDEKSIKSQEYYDVLIIGCNRTAVDLLPVLRNKNIQFLIIDHNPEVIKKLKKMGYNCIYGDINDFTILENIDLKKVKLVFSSVSDIETNLRIVNNFKNYNPDCTIVTVANDLDESLRLYKEGSTYVIVPKFLGGLHFSTMLNEYELDHDKYLLSKKKHLDYLINRIINWYKE
ncbi:MAG: cation:proton antiporter [Candidatus Woesearchaeota archaeon]